MHELLAREEIRRKIYFDEYLWRALRAVLLRYIILLHSICIICVTIIYRKYQIYNY